MINKDFEDFFKCFNSNDVKYLVIGGYAHIYYTEPRYTKDMDILVEPTKENSVKVYKSLCEFWDKVELGFPSDYFALKHQHGKCALGMGNPPNSIEIFTNLPGVEFSKAWGKRESFEYGESFVWVISRKDLEKNFEAVRKMEPKLGHKYSYFLEELRKWRKQEKG